MDAFHFDRLTRTVSTVLSRRTVARVLSLGALTLPGLADARKRKNKKKKITRNSFGCVNVGKFCRNAGQCCSGICQGKKGKKKCKGHDQSTCQAGQSPVICGGSEDVLCTSAAGPVGTCFSTTGNGAYCLTSAQCFPCQNDADCVPFCGENAACIVCEPFCGSIGTICAGSGTASCAFPP